jgi:hypothetical protein
MDDQVQGRILLTSCKRQDYDTIQLTNHLNSQHAVLY